MQFSRKQINIKLQSLNLTKVVKETYQLVKESFDKMIDIRIDVPESLPVTGRGSFRTESGLNELVHECSR